MRALSILLSTPSASNYANRRRNTISKTLHILEVVKYIDTHYSSDLTIESLLANIPLSRRNFEVKFKNALNTSIYQYILNCRCNHLADLLLTTDRPLAGFSNGSRL